MATWRAIHKGICTSKRLVTLEEWEQLLFVQMVVQADQHGRLSADPFQVRILCCPASRRSEDEIRDAIIKMSERGRRLLDLWNAEGAEVCQILEWDEMQPSAYLKGRGKSSHPDNPNDSAILESHEIPQDPTLERRKEKRREEMRHSPPTPPRGGRNRRRRRLSPEPEADRSVPEVSEMEKAGQRQMWAEILDDDPTAAVPDWYRKEMEEG